jgi:hypothetical protein
MADLGEYHLCDKSNNTLLAYPCCPEEIARELGLLRECEVVIY